MLSPVKMFLCSKLSCLGWRSADFLQDFFGLKWLLDQRKLTRGLDCELSPKTRPAWAQAFGLCSKSLSPCWPYNKPNSQESQSADGKLMFPDKIQVLQSPACSFDTRSTFVSGVTRVIRTQSCQTRFSQFYSYVWKISYKLVKKLSYQIFMKIC
jgi:hypothetical protein